MRIVVKRNTGVLGGFGRISLFVNDEEKMKLKYDEEQLIVTDKESVVIQVKQLTMSSKPVQLYQDDYVQIRLNQLYVALWWITIICLITSTMIYDKIFKLIFSAVAFFMIVFILVIGSDNYFIIERVDDNE